MIFSRKERAMITTVLIEGILLLAISVVATIEGFRLMFQPKDPKLLYDILGPGPYIILIGICMMAVGLSHLFVHYRKSLSIEKVALNQEMRIRVVGMIVVLVIYVSLISIVGYLMSTIVFFLLEFRLTGVKSWRVNIILTIATALVYYIIFVHYCQLMFPRGIILG